METAAKMILEDIRTKGYDTDNYPVSHDFFKNAESDIPDSLKLLLHTIILNNKKVKSKPKFQKEGNAISHSVISAVSTIPNLPGWSGFMENFTEKQLFKTTFIECSFFFNSLTQSGGVFSGWKSHTSILSS